MKIYRGIREKNGTIVTVTCNEIISNLNPRFDLRNHSPTGFEWGYGGSGPAQLALAILAEHVLDSSIAEKYYQAFKFKVIGGLKSDQWTLTSDDVERALQEIKTENRKAEDNENFRY